MKNVIKMVQFLAISVVLLITLTKIHLSEQEVNLNSTFKESLYRLDTKKDIQSDGGSYYYQRRHQERQRPQSYQQQQNNNNDYRESVPYTREFQIKQGRLKGLVKVMHPQLDLVNVDQFLGLPYAEAPVGSKRFMPPGMINSST